MSNYITPPYPIFTDVTGTPLDAGFVFIGAEDSDAIANPINVYWDKEKTQLADQPLRTRNGYISKDGSPCKIFIDQPSCSIFVKNRFNTTVLKDLSFDILSNSSSVVAAVGAEQERATSVETALDQKIDTTNTTLDSKINNESSRAQAAEDSLLIQLNAVGVGNKAYKTYALMGADKASIPAKSKVTVTNDSTESNNGDWQWDGVAFTKSAYDPLTQAKSYTDAQKSITLTAAAVNTDNAVSEIVTKAVDDEIIQGFTDKYGKLLAFIDKAGELDFYPTNQTKNRVNVIQENDDSDYIYLVLDKDGRILDGIDKHGNPVNSINQSSTSEIPLKTPLKTISNTVSVKSFNRISQKLALNTTAKGRSTDPDIIVTGNGNTHPKMVYVPQGWNGYTYWLAATPTFGVVGGQAAYENPHVWASNDMLTWVEPSGGRIDKPEDDNQSYWSDTHLVLDDDGWMYCIYRGSWFSFSDRCIVAKRSRDGVRWSDRIMIYNSNTDGGGADSGILSPAIYKSGTKWQMIDVLQDGKSIEFTTDYGNGVFRRSANEVIGKYEGYNTDKLVRYNPKQWGDTQQVWHIDALMVGNMHLHLVAVGDRGVSMSSELYLAWSQDGWNFKVLPKLDINASNAYRSSLSVKDISGSDVIFDLLLARTDGTIDLYELTLEIK